jgi:hypothetical protein
MLECAKYWGGKIAGVRKVFHPKTAGNAQSTAVAQMLFLPQTQQKKAAFTPPCLLIKMPNVSLARLL